VHLPLERYTCVEGLALDPERTKRLTKREHPLQSRSLVIINKRKGSSLIVQFSNASNALQKPSQQPASTRSDEEENVPRGRQSLNTPFQSRSERLFIDRSLLHSFQRIAEAVATTLLHPDRSLLHPTHCRSRRNNPRPKKKKAYKEADKARAPPFKADLE